MNVEEWLLQVRRLDALIQAKNLEVRQLRAMASDITGKPYDGMPITRTGIPSDRVGNAVMRIMSCEQEVCELIEEYINQREEILSVLECLPEQEYTVMHLYYVMGWLWEDIAVHVNLSRTDVWRKKKDALRRLEVVLTAKKEDGR